MPTEIPIASVTRYFAKEAMMIPILIVNDNTEVIQLLENILRTLGFKRIHKAVNAQQALEVLRETKIRLMLIDWELKVTLPDVSHIMHVQSTEFVRRLRRSMLSPNPYVPVLMLAHNLKIDHVLSARDEGVNGIVTKPFDAQQLCLALREVFENPRLFITAQNYRGPCRRKESQGTATNQPERRKRDICIVKAA
jgi:two-component system, chemotaxis family, chemotaxis protein CheY